MSTFKNRLHIHVTFSDPCLLPLLLAGVGEYTHYSKNQTLTIFLTSAFSAFTVGDDKEFDVDDNEFSDDQQLNVDDLEDEEEFPHCDEGNRGWIRDTVAAG